MKIHILSDGEFTGYGSVRLSVNCYLLSCENQNVLIDTGIGNNYFYDKEKYSIKFPRILLQSLKDTGNDPENISTIIYTHLHFDHSNGSFDSEGKCIFHNARHLIQETEWKRMLDAETGTRKKLFHNLYNEGKVELLYGSSEIDGRIKLVLCGGHTKGFQYVIADVEGQEHIFAGDIIPTVWHINNNNPQDIDEDSDKLSSIKSEILERCIESNAILYYQHSSMIKSSAIVRNREKFKTLKL